MPPDGGPPAAAAAVFVAAAAAAVVDPTPDVAEPAEELASAWGAVTITGVRPTRKTRKKKEKSENNKEEEENGYCFNLGGGHRGLPNRGYEENA